MSKLTKEQIGLIALDSLKRNEKNSFLKIDDYNLTYKKQDELRDGSIKNVWIFRYVIKIFGDEKWMFLAISDEDGKILYGVHDTGYFEIQ